LVTEDPLTPVLKDSKRVQLRPFFGYYGGKWRDTPNSYPKPAYKRIVEPFAGSAGYSLRHHECEVILYELDPVVAGVWDFLINQATPEYIRGLPDLGPKGSVDDLSVPEEVKSLIGFWLNRGVSRPRKRPSKWMRDKIRPGSFWGSRVRETIASQLPYIKHWKIYPLSYERCRHTKEATWFVDPPYQVTGHHYYFGSSEINYESLADWCKTRKGEVIVCENEGATWLDFHQVASKSKTTRRNRTSSEVFWYQRS